MPDDSDALPSLSLLALLRGRCPRCGKGALYSGVLSIAPHCSQCQLSFKNSDVGDGAAFFVITIMCLALMVGVAWLELVYAPSAWVHVVVWLPTTLIVSIVLLRVIKSWLVLRQYTTRPDSFKDSAA